MLIIFIIRSRLHLKTKNTIIIIRQLPEKNNYYTKRTELYIKTTVCLPFLSYFELFSTFVHSQQRFVAVDLGAWERSSLRVTHSLPHSLTHAFTYRQSHYLFQPVQSLNKQEGVAVASSSPPPRHEVPAFPSCLLAESPEWCSVHASSSSEFLEKPSRGYWE